jgi:hypothetical protein
MPVPAEHSSRSQLIFLGTNTKIIRFHGIRIGDHDDYRTLPNLRSFLIQGSAENSTNFPSIRIRHNSIWNCSARQNVIRGQNVITAVVVWAKVRCRGDVCLSFDLAWTGSSQISNPPVTIVNICPEI